MAEHLIRNEKVVGSTPISLILNKKRAAFSFLKVRLPVFYCMFVLVVFRLKSLKEIKSLETNWCCKFVV